MAGNPARRIRDRRDPCSSGPTASVLVGRLERFAREAREQASTVLQRCWTPAAGFFDRPGADPTVRASCDAVEIADLLLGGPPPRIPAQALLHRLAGRQDAASGLIPEYGQDGGDWDDGSVYHILSVGYALDLLGSSFQHPIRMNAVALLSMLDGLPWTDRAWHAGAWVDAYATALYWNRRWFKLHGRHPDGDLETLFGWLLTRQDPWSGLWGTPTPAEGRRQPVNGYYRLTRGSFAQFGVPVPRPEATIDAVLDTALSQWHTGAGFAFDPRREPATSTSRA